MDAFSQFAMNLMSGSLESLRDGLMRSLAKNGATGNASAAKVFLEELHRSQPSEEELDETEGLNDQEIIELIEAGLKELKAEIEDFGDEEE